MGSKKNILRKMNDFFSGWERIRVVLLGSKGTGKTVFLTSVGDQLRHHVESFNLNGWSVVFDPDNDDKIQEKARKSKVPVFPYAESRAYLSKGEWPVKTKDWSVLTVPFMLKKDKEERHILLEMVDLPGERVADFAMVGRSYRDWCVWFEREFGGVTGFSPNYKLYLEKLFRCADNEDGKDAGIRVYKDYLCDEYANYALSLTPSIVKLGCDAKQRAGSKEQFKKDIEDIPVGISKELQFIPLPTESFAKGKPHNQWIKSFSKAYEAYKKAVIEPIASWCGHANCLLYFVDVLDVLRRGPEVYNSELKFATQAFRHFRHNKPNNIFMKPIIGLRDLFVTHVGGIYVIATKADRACHQGDKMVSLAKDMFKRIVDRLGLESDKIDYRSCAAVDTSDEYVKEQAIRARIKKGKDETGRSIIESEQYQVDPVPEKWPIGDWYSVPMNWQETFPLFAEREDCPPKQKGLDKIICKVLGLE